MARHRHRQPIVVDGANVAHEELSSSGKPKVANLVAMMRELADRGYEPVVIVDASLWHEIDDPDQLDAMIERQQVRQVPAGTDADFFVLETAENLDAPVVSNDLFRNRRERYPWVRERRVPYMVVGGQIELYEDAMARAG